MALSPTIMFCAAILISLAGEIFTCGGKKCSYRTCSNYYPGYSPNPSQGSCTWQSNRVQHHYTTHKQGSGCPGDTYCTGSDLWQYSCSCRQREQCWWASWGTWTGSISRDTCGNQTRYRKNQATYTYVYRVDNCAGVDSSCPRKSDSEQRAWCNCRKAEKCHSTQWSSWVPQPRNGQCIAQSRYHDKIPTYTYVQKKDNCGGINAYCPGRLTYNRTFCQCEYKECVKGAWTSWTSWEIDSSTGNCPNQRRLQKYRSITKYKDAYWNCNDIGPKSCPNPVPETREKEVTCPKLSIPANGKHLDATCDGAKSKCKAMCKMNCNHGYELHGNTYVTCKGNGTWDRPQGTCKDTTAPSIKCPEIGHFYTDPNENYVMVDLPDATATDNSGLSVTINKDQDSPLKVLGGTTVDVRYTAADTTGNTESCTIKIQAIDNEAPKIISCPGDKFVSAETLPYRYYWKEPTFHDNVDGDNVVVIPNYTPGTNFRKGKHVITYIGRDKAFNTVNCSFTLEVETAKCPIKDPPKHGSAQCNIKKDGIHEAFICTISCKQGHWFLQGDGIPKLYNFYVCGLKGEWKGQNMFNSMTGTPTGAFEALPKDTPMWPDCAVGESPDGVMLDFHVFGGSCKDQAQMEKLKKDFLKAIMSDMIINPLFCLINQQNCAIENIKVYCATRKRRSTTGMASGKQVVIKFSYALRNKALAAKSSVDVNKLNSLTTLLNAEKANLLIKLHRTAPNVFKDYGNTSVTVTDAVIGCEPGFEFNVVNGSDDVNSRTKCLKCPRGTYYMESSRKCSVCKQGFYQDEEGMLFCKTCAQGKSTVGNLGRDYHVCKAICQPGTYSTNGLETCIACPLGTYQPISHSTSCKKCPSGKITSDVGATRQSDCTKPGVFYKIHSEGCADAGVVGCGTTSVIVNNKDYSQHKRGMNFVVIDENTGKHISSISFDWHGDKSACLKTYQWISALKDHVIVLAGVQGEATWSYDSNYCKKALLLIGGKEPFQTEYRGSFALAGYKGQRNNVQWIKQKKSSAGRGPTDLNGTIKLF